MISPNREWNRVVCSPVGSRGSVLWAMPQWDSSSHTSLPPTLHTNSIALIVYMGTECGVRVIMNCYFLFWLTISATLILVSELTQLIDGNFTSEIKWLEFKLDSNYKQRSLSQMMRFLALIVPQLPSLAISALRRQTMDSEACLGEALTSELRFERSETLFVDHLMTWKACLLTQGLHRTYLHRCLQWIRQTNQLVGWKSRQSLQP